jgi:hypothetical protein
MSAQPYFVIATVHPPVCEGDDYAGFDLRKCEVDDAIKAWKDKPVYYEHDYSLPPIGYVHELFKQKDESLGAKMVISDKHPHAQDTIRKIASGDFSVSLGSVVNGGAFVNGKCTRIVPTEVTLCDVPGRDTKVKKMATVYDGNILTWSMSMEPQTNKSQISTLNKSVDETNHSLLQQEEMQNSRIDMNTNLSSTNLATMQANGMVIPASAVAAPPQQQMAAPPQQQQQMAAPPQQQQQQMAPPPQQQQMAPPPQQQQMAAPPPQQQTATADNSISHGLSADKLAYLKAMNGVTPETEEAFWEQLLQASLQQKSSLVEGIYTEERDEWGLDKNTVLAMDNTLVGVLCSMKGGLHEKEAARKAAEQRALAFEQKLAEKDRELTQEKTARSILEKDKTMFMKRITEMSTAFPVRSVEERFPAKPQAAVAQAPFPSMAPPPGYQYQQPAAMDRTLVAVNASGGNYVPGQQYHQAAFSDVAPKEQSTANTSDRFNDLIQRAKGYNFKAPQIVDAMPKRARME